MQILHYRKRVGTVFEPEEIEAELKKGGYKAVAIIHGETSTSMMQTVRRDRQNL